MPTIFISYKEEDSGYIRHIVKELESKGLSTWYYQRDCNPGPTYTDQIVKAIMNCEVFLVFISSQTLNSEQINSEVIYAFEHKRKILPILLGLNVEDFKMRKSKWAFTIADATYYRFNGQNIPQSLQTIYEGVCNLLQINPSPSPIPSIKSLQQFKQEEFNIIKYTLPANEYHTVTDFIAYKYLVTYFVDEKPEPNYQERMIERIEACIKTSHIFTYRRIILNTLYKNNLELRNWMKNEVKLLNVLGKKYPGYIRYELREINLSKLQTIKSIPPFPYDFALIPDKEDETSGLIIISSKIRQDQIADNYFNFQSKILFNYFIDLYEFLWSLSEPIEKLS